MLADGWGYAPGPLQVHTHTDGGTTETHVPMVCARVGTKTMEQTTDSITKCNMGKSTGCGDTQENKLLQSSFLSLFPHTSIILSRPLLIIAGCCVVMGLLLNS